MKNNFISTVILTGVFFLFIHPVSVFSQDKECKSVIELKQVEAQKTIVIKYDVPTSNIGPSMGTAYERLYGFLMSNNIAPAGPPFSVYYSFDPNGNTVFEAGVPVNGPVNGNDEIVYKEFPAMKVVTTLYKGAYDTMEPVYSELNNYITTNGLESTGTSWEVYLTDPGQGIDPKDNQTLIYFPLK
jgi:effector-binding domain-containing protein